MNTTIRTILSGLALLALVPLHAQDPGPAIAQWLQQRQAAMGLTAADVAEWTVTSFHTDKRGTTYAYIQQQVNGLPVDGSVANFALREGVVVHHGDRLQRDLAGRASSASPAMGATDALRQVVAQLGLAPEEGRVLRVVSPTELVLEAVGVSHDPIPARLLYQPVEGGAIRLAWDLTIRSVSTPNWWHIAVDAHTGAILRTRDHMVQCQVHHDTFARRYNALDELKRSSGSLLPKGGGGAGYRVFPFPTESPNHGPHELVNDPADAVASPFGWHDVDGIPGAEYTITRGNNVFAHEDLNNDDQPGYAPDGGPGLLFDSPYEPPQAPLDYLDASIINLFHACNVLHDVLYRYGFDEESGNFQENNYGNGGLDADPVIAQAQDGGGMNNANFGTPPDGQSGRMQMYLWRASADSTLFVNTPLSIAGVYGNSLAGFGPPLPAVPITADVVLAEDAVPPVNDACEPLVNASAIVGRIALVDRGQCTFISKVQALEAAGALAVIVVNNVPGAPFSMGGTGGGGITIPSVMVSQATGDLIKQALLAGPVNATLVGTQPEDYLDSSFDNGIIAHEYGHGVSNRLTGGGANVGCLWNDEQMGEGGATTRPDIHHAAGRWARHHPRRGHFRARPTHRWAGYPSGTLHHGHGGERLHVRQHQQCRVEPTPRRGVRVGHHAVGPYLGADRPVRFRHRPAHRHGRQQPRPATGDGRHEAAALRPGFRGRA